jgi:hypothetical protein
VKRSPMPARTSRLSRVTARRPAKKRKPSEYARVYGSKVRVAWVARQPCIVPDCWTWRLKGCENAHIGTGGMGRKADAATIVPACTPHHGELHRTGIRTFSAKYSLDLDALAAETDVRYRAHLTRTENAA